MSQTSSTQLGAKLSLPDGNAETANINIDEITNVLVMPSGNGGWLIVINLKNGECKIAAYSEDNIAYLLSVGLQPLYPVGSPSLTSEPPVITISKGPK